jgi:hypothetical protein
MNIHVTRGEESSGPYSLEQVQSYLADGLLLPTDLAWHEGLENWIPLSELVGQSALPEPVPPPPSTPDEIDLISADQVPVESVAKPRSRKRMLIGIGAGVAVLVIAAGVWFGLLRPDGSKQEKRQLVQEREAKDDRASGGNSDSDNGANLSSKAKDQFVLLNPFNPRPPETNPKVDSGNPNGEFMPNPLPGDYPSLKVLAEKGDAAAQLKLGVMMALGKGVKKNKAEAV